MRPRSRKMLQLVACGPVSIARKRCEYVRTWATRRCDSDTQSCHYAIHTTHTHTHTVQCLAHGLRQRCMFLIMRCAATTWRRRSSDGRTASRYSNIRGNAKATRMRAHVSQGDRRARKRHRKVTSSISSSRSLSRVALVRGGDRQHRKPNRCEAEATCGPHDFLLLTAIESEAA